MLSPTEFLAEMEVNIRHVYRRPRMWGTPEAVESSLFCLHLSWAVIQEREPEFRGELSRQCELAGTNHAFAAARRRNDPLANEAEVMTYVLLQWRQISNRLGVLHRKGGCTRNERIPSEDVLICYVSHELRAGSLTHRATK